MVNVLIFFHFLRLSIYTSHPVYQGPLEGSVLFCGNFPPGSISPSSFFPMLRVNTKSHIFSPRNCSWTACRPASGHLFSETIILLCYYFQRFCSRQSSWSDWGLETLQMWGQGKVWGPKYSLGTKVQGIVLGPSYNLGTKVQSWDQGTTRVQWQDFSRKGCWLVLGVQCSSWRQWAILFGLL